MSPGRVVPVPGTVVVEPLGGFSPGRVVPDGRDVLVERGLVVVERGGPEVDVVESSVDGGMPGPDGVGPPGVITGGDAMGGRAASSAGWVSVDRLITVAATNTTAATAAARPAVAPAAATGPRPANRRTAATAAAGSMRTPTRAPCAAGAAAPVLTPAATRGNAGRERRNRRGGRRQCAGNARRVGGHTGTHRVGEAGARRGSRGSCCAEQSGDRLFTHWSTRSRLGGVD